MNSRVNALARWATTGLAAALIAAAVSLQASAVRAELKVSASIAPLHSLVAQVMAGTGTPRLLIPGGTSPHGFALTPSQARALSESDAVFWIGPALETALVKPIATLAARARVSALAEAPGLIRHAVRDVTVIGQDHDRGHGHQPDHGHDHGKTTYDPHYWLDPENAKAMLREIARVLGDAAPEHRAGFTGNAARAAAAIDAVTAAFKRRLDPLKSRPFIAFHDAYQYLERRFDLSVAGILAVDPDRPAGARHVSELRAHIREMDVRCLFTEPQFPSRLAAALIEGTATRLGVLDPLGSAHPPGPALYTAMLTANLASIEACLADSAGGR